MRQGAISGGGKPAAAERTPGIMGGGMAMPSSGGASTARNTGRVSARPGAASGAATARTTASTRVTAGAKPAEEEKKKPTGNLARRPTMSGQNLTLKRADSRAGSAMRGASSSR